MVSLEAMNTPGHSYFKEGTMEKEKREQLARMGIIPLGDALAEMMFPARMKREKNYLLEAGEEEIPAVEIDPNKKIKPEALFEALRVVMENQKIMARAVNVLLKESGLEPLSFK
jgi:hypothetical protein